MPVIETKHFGPIEYDPESELEFPRGLPGFEKARRFVALRFPASDPLIYLQSLEEPALCFITAPALAVEPAYSAEFAPEDLELVGLAPGTKPGEDGLWLAVVAMREDGPTVNLLAPVIVNPRTRKCVQAIAPRSGYSHRQALLAPVDTGGQPAVEEALAC